MPTFETHGPISVAIELVVGDARIVASEREDTVVQVLPSDPAHEPDARAAEQTRVEYTAAGLLVKTAKQRTLGLFGKPGSVDVTIELPAGSRVQADASIAAFHCSGRLGECRVKTGCGDIEVGQAGPLDLSTGAGGVSVDHVSGHADVSTGTGKIRLREVDGTAAVKNSNGDIWIGEIAGDLRARTANGDISVGRAGADVTASTAAGDVRVAEVVRGSASLKTPSGEIEIGIQAGTAARLDVHTRYGRVRSQLDAADSPDPSDEIAEVQARTSYGDIVIRRS